MVKFLLYLLVLPLVIYAIDSINFTNIFKKNKIVQARIFYILLIFGLSIWYVVLYMIFYI